MLFSSYGPILDIVALKTTKMRGQAHIVFRDLQAATQAMRSLEGFQFLGQELVSRYPRAFQNVLLTLCSHRESSMPRRSPILWPSLMGHTRCLVPLPLMLS
jgi:RNA recognition motif-containing protein